MLRDRAEAVADGDGAAEAAERGSETQESLASRLDYLTDLFRRRLSQDRESARAFDALYQELTAARSAIEGMLVMPLARRMFLLIDRLDQDGSEFAQTVADELAEMLYVQGFTPVAVDPGDFDPATQEAIAVPVIPGRREGQVVGYARRGWCYQDRLIQPALVEVATSAAASAREPNDGGGPAGASEPGRDGSAPAGASVPAGDLSAPLEGSADA
jgi:molecular chaperone GrpE (heat shock protein)